MRRPEMWWTTVKGGRRAKRSGWKWRNSTSRQAKIAALEVDLDMDDRPLLDGLTDHAARVSYMVWLLERQDKLDQGRVR